MALKYFNYDEFDSPDEKGSFINMDRDFLLMLDEARGIAKTSFKINSGFRSETHNKKVGGKANSSHLSGKAVDIACNTSRDRFKILSALQEVGFNRFGIADTFIHVDNDKTKSPFVIWTY